MLSTQCLDSIKRIHSHFYQIAGKKILYKFIFRKNMRLSTHHEDNDAIISKTNNTTQPNLLNIHHDTEEGV